MPCLFLLLTLDIVLNSHSTNSQPTNTMPPQNFRFDFLALPPKARLRIYKYLLVCKPQDQITPEYRPAAAQPLTPSILATCKQIHAEACPILYSKNEFLVSEPERIFRWFTQIGRLNIKHLRKVRIFVEAVYSTKEIPFLSTASESLSWYKLLDQLAREATGLRHLHIYWDADPTCGHYGAGKDLRFVRELAKIHGLKSMDVAGYYAIHWPRYLTEKMGILVQEKDRSQPYLQYLRKYQQGTEKLVP